MALSEKQIDDFPSGADVFYARGSGRGGVVPARVVAPARSRVIVEFRLGGHLRQASVRPYKLSLKEER